MTLEVKTHDIEVVNLVSGKLQMGQHCPRIG